MAKTLDKRDTLLSASQAEYGGSIPLIRFGRADAPERTVVGRQPGEQRHMATAFDVVG